MTGHDMILHDQLAHAIEQEMGLAHGVDFLIAHPLGDDGKQCGDAYLLRWNNTVVPKPDIEMMKQCFLDSHRESFESKMLREMRDYALMQTDWTQNPDVPKPVKAKFVAYRQALRDLTGQSGFPHVIEWPNHPQ
jgi:hypothetical protein